MRARELESGRIPTPRQVFEALDRYVIGQTYAKRAISIAAYNHMKRLVERAAGKKGLIKKSNVLMIGPTGSGKTHISRQLAKVLDVPFVVVDATEYTEAGYYGKDIEVMVAELLFKTGQNVEETERGIIFVDEIDKIARRSHGARTGAGSRDIGGEGVQQALLKLLEGTEVFVPLNVTQHWAKHDFVQVDTTDILFICAGTFSDMYAYGGEKAIGMRPRDGANDGKTREAGPAAATKRASEKDLLEYGMLSEFLGRLPVVVELGELTLSELERVMTEPPDSIVKEYQHLLAADDIQLRVEAEAVRAIAGHAIRKRTGARGLRSIFERVMHDVLFEAPERRGETIVVDERFVAERLSQRRE
ncbi:MAG: ATP-dependent Clp protease ATP-binding subunit ClpX [Deltaproteobacteria bacterium]|nr:ATP-dependent Clp protease ATP-binding subunit ClpX [Deltaproteobacteria bacterium]